MLRRVHAAQDRDADQLEAVSVLTVSRSRPAETIPRSIVRVPESR
jgi:hypothetical protein